MTSNVLLSGPLLFLISESSQRNTRIARVSSLAVVENSLRWWKAVAYCGKELSVAAQDHPMGLDCQNRLLLNATSGKSSITCRSHLHFVVFQTKSTVRPPYMPPEWLETSGNGLGTVW